MEVVLGILMGVIWILIVAALRSLTTLFHEFGHAIPALAFTEKDVHVYVGTYGDKSDGLHLDFGRLQVFFKFNFFNWNIGMCSHQGSLALWKTLLIVFGGPVASMLFAVPFIYILANYEIPEIGMYVLIAFIIAASIDFLVNIFPNSNPIYTQGGQATYNDGYTMYLLLSRLFLTQEYFDLEEELAKGNKDEFFKRGIAIIDKGKADRVIYELMIFASIEEKEMEDALYLYQRMKQEYPLRKNDFFELGKINQHLNQHQIAIQFFDKYLYYNYQDVAALVLRGISKKESALYDAAIRDFTTALQVEPANIDALIHRGFSYMKKKDLLSATQDFEQAKTINPNYPLLLKYSQLL